MATSLNACTFAGWLAKDPEAKYMDSGKVVVKFSIPVNGYKKDDTWWLNVEVWGKQAEVAMDWVKKGTFVMVTGSMRMEKWTDKTSGEEKSRYVLNCSNLVLGPKTGSNEQSHGSSATGSSAKAAKSQPVEEEEIPF